MTTTTELNPTAPPLFPIGFEVPIERYHGIVDVAHQPSTHCRDWRPQGHRIEGIRRRPDVSVIYDDDDNEIGRTTTYPDGYEYQLFSIESGSEWGWESEADLLKAGYRPTAKEAAHVV